MVALELVSPSPVTQEGIHLCNGPSGDRPRVGMHSCSDMNLQCLERANYVINASHSKKFSSDLGPAECKNYVSFVAHKVAI